jgi:hypothetical protein
MTLHKDMGHELICRVIPFDFGDQSNEGSIEHLKDGPELCDSSTTSQMSVPKIGHPSLEEVNSEAIQAQGISLGPCF